MQAQVLVSWTDGDRGGATALRAHETAGDRLIADLVVPVTGLEGQIARREAGGDPGRRRVRLAHSREGRNLARHVDVVRARQRRSLDAQGHAVRAALRVRVRDRIAARAAGRRVAVTEVPIAVSRTA